MKSDRPRAIVAYYRVSTDKQGIAGLGMDAQQAAVEEFGRVASAQCFLCTMRWASTTGIDSANVRFGKLTIVILHPGAQISHEVVLHVNAM